MNKLYEWNKLNKCIHSLNNTKTMYTHDAHVFVGVVSRITEVKELIMDALLGSPSGTILVGDKSTSEDIANYFHGVSRSSVRVSEGMFVKYLVIYKKLAFSCLLLKSLCLLHVLFFIRAGEQN